MSVEKGEVARRMSSAGSDLEQLSFGAAAGSRPLTAGGRSDTEGSHTSLWRPWVSSSRDGVPRCPQSKLSCPYSRATAPGCFLVDGKPQIFQHPVRLFWSKSKSFDYLYSDGETLLRNFPIQATISFYDESDSEDEDENSEEDGDCKERIIQQSHFTSYN